jgi:hypothetical protein
MVRALALVAVFGLACGPSRAPGHYATEATDAANATVSADAMGSVDAGGGAGGDAGSPSCVGAATIIARLPLYGGYANQGVATDGVRYLFASTVAGVPLTIATATGPAGALEVRSRLPAAGATTNVVTLGEGRFFFVAGSQAVLIDATDPSSPRELFRQAFTLPVTPPDNYWVSTEWVLPAVVPVSGGALYLEERIYYFSDGTSFPQGGIFFIPVGDTGIGAPVAVNAAAADQGSLVYALDADGDTVTWAASVPVDSPYIKSAPRLTWGRIDSAGRLVARVDFSPWEWRTSPAWNDVFAFQTSAGRIGMVGQFGTSVGQMAPALADPVPCDESTGACADLTPGCGSPALPVAGRYLTNCAPFSDSCDPGTACVQLSVDGGTAGCDVPTWVCASTGQSYPEVREIPLNGAGRMVGALLDGNFLFMNGDYGGTKGYDVRDDAPAQLDIDHAAIGGFQRATGHLTLGGSWLAYVLRRDPTVDADAPLAAQRFPRVTGPGHGDAIAMAHAASGDLLVSGAPSIGTVDLQAGRYTGWHLLDSVAPLLRGTWVVRGADRDVGLRSGSAETGFTNDCGGGQGLAAVAIAEDATTVLHPLCSPGDVWGTGASYGNEFPSAGDRLLFTIWGNARLAVWDLKSDSLGPLADVPVGVMHENNIVSVLTSDDGDEVATVGYDVSTGVFTGTDVRIFSARPFTGTPLRALRLSPAQTDSRDVIKWSGDRLLAANGGAVTLVRLDGAPAPAPLVLDAGGAVRQLWIRGARAFAALDTADGRHFLVQLAAADDLQEVARFPLDIGAYALLDDGARIAAATPSEIAVLAPGCAAP